MFLKTDPIITNSEKESWIHIEDFSYTEKKNNFKFLYIGGNDEVLQCLNSCFHGGTVAESFVQAKKLINKALINNIKVPDVIFIDIPLNKAELENFSYFLKENSLLSITPLIYNERQLNSDTINLLTQLDLVDDVMD